MPKGLIIIDSIIAAIGVVISILLSNGYIFWLALFLISVFHIALGVINTTKYIDTKFMRWLFGD